MISQLYHSVYLFQLTFQNNFIFFLSSQARHYTASSQHIYFFNFFMRNTTDYFSDTCNYQPLLLFLINRGEMLYSNVWNTSYYLSVKTICQKGRQHPNNKTQQSVVKGRCYVARWRVPGLVYMCLPQSCVA